MSMDTGSLSRLSLIMAMLIMLNSIQQSCSGSTLDEMMGRTLSVSQPGGDARSKSLTVQESVEDWSPDEAAFIIFRSGEHMEAEILYLLL